MLSGERKTTARGTAWTKSGAALAVVAAFAWAGPAQALLLGEQVTGSLSFPAADPGNYYDPTLPNPFAPPPFFVPAGYGNASSQVNVVIGSPIVEFGFDDTANLITADFSDTQLTISDVTSSGSLPWTQTLTFANPGVIAQLNLASSNFTPGLTYSLNAGTITISWGNINDTDPVTAYMSTDPFTFVAVFDLSAVRDVPEPATLSLFGLGLVGLAATRRLRRA